MEKVNECSKDISLIALQIKMQPINNYLYMATL